MKETQQQVDQRLSQAGDNLPADVTHSLLKHVMTAQREAVTAESVKKLAHVSGCDVNLVVEGRSSLGVVVERQLTYSVAKALILAGALSSAKTSNGRIIVQAMFELS